MEGLYDGVNHQYDMRMLKWLKDNYSDKGIADTLTMSITDFLDSIEIKTGANKFSELNHIEKAIRQDTKKMLLSAKQIYNYSENKRKCKSPDRSVLDYDEEKDALQINMEYFIYKYRVIVEYVFKILNQVVYLDFKKYNKALGDKSKRLKTFEISNLKLEYIRKIIEKQDKGSLDIDWFDEIRQIRNQLVHEGASCLVMENEYEPLFQIYDLEVNSLFAAEEFLSNGRVMSCNYFIVTTVAYLTYYIDKIFYILRNVDFDDFEWFGCRLNYKVTGSQMEEIRHEMDRRIGITSYISVYQESLFDTLSRYFNQNNM